MNKLFKQWIVPLFFITIGAVIAAFALALAGGLPPERGAYLANLAASVVVAKVGTYAVSRNELLSALEREGAL